MQKLTLLAAGSLRTAFTDLLAAFRQQYSGEIHCVFAPAGLLRQRIESGEHAHLYASASLAQAQRLAAQGLALPARPFAANRLCISVRNIPALTEPPLLQILADRQWRLATSTPGDDPAGDYALALFQLIDKLQPGLGLALQQRALPLVGGAHSQPIPAQRLAAEWLINSGQADIFIGYASYRHVLAACPGIAIRPLPAALSPAIIYGLCLLTSAPADPTVSASSVSTAAMIPASSPSVAFCSATTAARQLADFICGTHGQQRLQQHGFLPVTS